MYFAKKSEYNDIREKSFLQWLDEMEKHDDVAVRCGVKLAREYMQYYINLSPARTRAILSEMDDVESVGENKNRRYKINN